MLEQRTRFLYEASSDNPGALQNNEDGAQTDHADLNAQALQVVLAISTPVVAKAMAIILERSGRNTVATQSIEPQIATSHVSDNTT